MLNVSNRGRDRPINGRGLPHAGFWDQPLGELERILKAGPGGLTSEEAAERRERFGANIIALVRGIAPFLEFAKLLANPLILVLLAASTVGFALGDRIGGLIIIVNQHE